MRAARRSLSLPKEDLTQLEPIKPGDLFRLAPIGGAMNGPKVLPIAFILILAPLARGFNYRCAVAERFGWIAV